MEGEGESVLPVTAETRGKKEDAALATAFDRIMTEGTCKRRPKSAAVPVEK